MFQSQRTRVSTKGQRVSTANGRTLSSRAAFLFSFEPRLSFHGSLILESFAECFQDRNVVKRLRKFLLLFSYWSWTRINKQPIKNWSNDEYVISKTEFVLKATTVTVLSEPFWTKCKQGISSGISRYSLKIKILYGFGLEIRNLHSVLISLY